MFAELGRITVIRTDDWQAHGVDSKCWGRANSDRRFFVWRGLNQERVYSAAAVTRCEEVVDHLLLRLYLLELVGFLLPIFEIAEHLPVTVGGLVSAHLLGALFFQLVESGVELLLSFDCGIGRMQHRLELSGGDGLLHGSLARLVGNRNLGGRLFDGAADAGGFQLQFAERELFLLLDAFAEAQHRGEGEAMGHGWALSCERHQLADGILIGAEGVGPLLQECVERREVFDGAVEDRIGVAMVCADADEIFRTRVGGHQEA